MTEKVNAAIPVAAGNHPDHVAIIMDGNNRWAKSKKLIGIAGHKAGVEAVRAVVKTCAEAGVKVLTIFAFSSENWRRPQDEVSALMRLFLLALQREVKKLHRNNIQLTIIGDREKFSPLLQEHMAKAETLTQDNDGMKLVVAANYGGHWDITQATKSIAVDVAEGRLKPEDVSEDIIQARLCIGDLPMPDLLIRTAGEHRVSNFMLWQLAYSEFYFTDLYWPDFREQEMLDALKAYAQRRRRFGQTDEQIDGEK